MLPWALVAALYAVSVAASTSVATSCPCDAFTNHTALIDFYYQTQGPHWSPAVPSNVTGWGTHLPVCEWTGLSCEGNLLVMELTWFFLNGTIPPTFWADVDNLGNITFASASIYYPPDFKGATKLQDITYYGDSSGNICLPDAWAELPSLVSIRAFNVGVLTCNLPTSWGAMSKLQTLIMPSTFPSNQALPASWSGMTSLQVLDLSNSILNGTIPDTWSSLRQLRSFNLFSCVALGGNLPAWLGNNTHLAFIALGSNAFVGSLPEEWSNARGLTYIDVSGNQLTGPLPPTWGRLSNLTTLWLSSNTLTGTLPPSWVGLGSLTTLQLQYNHLTGPIPATWYSLLHHDFNCAGQYAGCKQVTFNNNWLTGTPDLCLFAQLNVPLTAVANNNFTGMPDISCFTNGCNSQRVQAAFTGNHFCGECSENYCNCTVLEGETIAEERSLSIIETSSTVTCCTSCQTTPGCVAAVFFSIAGLHYCDLKNVSSPLVAKTGYSVLRW